MLTPRQPHQPFPRPSLGPPNQVPWRACPTKLPVGAASTASVPWLGCWKFRSRRSATGRSATRRSSRSGARADIACTPATRWSSSASSRRRSRAGLSAADAHRLLAEHSAAASRLSDDGRGAGTRLLVLLAERDPVAAELEQFFLRTEGYEVSVAFAVGEAEEHWLDSRPQLAIVELMISGGQGAQLCERLKQRRCRSRARHLGPRGARRGAGRGRRRLPAEAARPARARLDRQGPARDRARWSLAPHRRVASGRSASRAATRGST